MLGFLKFFACFFLFNSQSSQFNGISRVQKSRTIFATHTITRSRYYYIFDSDDWTSWPTAFNLHAKILLFRIFFSLFGQDSRKYITQHNQFENTKCVVFHGVWYIKWPPHKKSGRKKKKDDIVCFTVNVFAYDEASARESTFPFFL